MGGVLGVYFVFFSKFVIHLWLLCVGIGGFCMIFLCMICFGEGGLYYR